MRVLVLSALYYSCALFSLVNPVFGLFFFIHIVIFRPESLVWGILAFGRLHLLTAIMVLIGCFIHWRKFSLKPIAVGQKKNLFLLALFILWLCVVSAFAEASKELSFEKTLDVFKIFLICFVFSKLVNTERRIDQYVWVTLISFGLMSFWGFLQALAGNERLDTLWPGGSNYIGAQLVMMTPLAVAKVMDSRAKGRLIFFACVISIVICTFATQSRGAFLGLSAAIAVFILSAKYRIRMFVVIGLMVLIAYPWVLEPYYKRISTVFESSSTLKQDPAVEARLILWKMAVRMWQDHPIAGIGLDNFSDVRLKYRPIFDHLIGQEEAREIVFTTEQRFPHGMYTGMLAETGTVGMVLLAILFLRNALMRFPTSRGDRDGPDISLLARGAQAGLIGFAVAATFGDYQYLETLYFQLFFVEAIKGCVQARAFVAAAEPAKPVLALNPA